MKTFFKILLYILVWSLIGALLIGGTILLGESLELGIQIFLGVFIAWVLFLIIRRIIVRWRAKKRVEGLIQEEVPEDEQEKKGWRERFFPQGSGFSGRFRKVVSILRDSRLKAQGDALYVLPWYLLMDPAGSRRELVHRADLPTPTIHDPSLTSDGTSFDWYLYNQAVTIEVPEGHIRTPGNREKSEWKQLLQGLMQYRRKEPLNGIVVNLDAKHLLETDSAILAEEGHELRGRIDEVMNGLKLRLPIYLVIAGIEDLPGMRQWAQSLEPGQLEDVMGIAADEDNDEPGPVFVQRAVRKVADRLKDLVLVSLSGQKNSAELLALPGLVESLAEPLASFSGRAFETNPYQESPMLRGLYLGGAIERESDGLDVEKLYTGLFLRDLFSEVVPADRRLVSTLTSAERAENFTRRVVLSGWTIAVIAAFALLGWTYVADSGYLNSTTGKYAGSFARQPRIQENIDTTADMREMIVATDEEVSAWLMPWFNYESPPAWVLEMRQLYVERFERNVLEPADASLAKQVAAGAKTGAKNKGKDGRGQYDAVSTSLWSLVNRINLINAHLQGEPMEDMLAMPGAFDVLGELYPGDFGEGLQGRMHENYIQYLAWRGDDEQARSELAKAQKQLLTVLRTQLTGLDWLIPWANGQFPGKGVRLTDYWTGSGSVPEEVRVDPAFTTEGKAAIDEFLERLAATDPDSDELKKMQSQFAKLYQRRYLDAWEQFALNFQQGSVSLRGRSEYGDMIDAMASPRNPFLRLLNDMAAEIQPFAKKEGTVLPEWAVLTLYFQDVRAFGEDDGADNGKRNKALTKMGLKALKVLGPVGKALAGAGKKGLKTQKKLAKKGGADLDAALEQSSEAYGEYRKALLDVAFNADIKSVSFAAASSLFLDPDNPGAGDGPEARAWNSVRKFQTLAGKENKGNAAFWRVYAGPMEVITDYEVSEAACYLQGRWTDGLLVELEGVPEYKKGELMFGPEGKVWGFLNTDAKPFVKRQFGKGYVPVRAVSRSLPLKSEFLKFVSRGRDGAQVRKEVYPVGFNAYPTTAEPLSGPQPSMTTLTLECPDNQQQLVNLNFAVNKTMEWKEVCGDVRLEVEVNGLRFTKTWTGPKAFPEFLQDFRDGAKRLTPSDFGEAGKGLANIGVESIQVDYEINGHKDVIGALRQVPSKAPTLVAGCWERGS